jgi:AcrR family transcriptional regulator
MDLDQETRSQHGFNDRGIQPESSRVTPTNDWSSVAHVPAEVRRQQLIDAAYEIISAEGVQSATTRRIADRAGASLAVVHYCFRDKDELYLGVFRRLASDIIEFSDTGTLGDSPGQRAEQYIVRAAEWALSDPQRAHAMYETTLWATRRREGERTMAASVYEIHLAEIHSLLQMGNSDEQSAVEGAERIVLSAIDGLLLQWVAGGNDQRFRSDSARAGAMVRRELEAVTLTTV